MPLLEPVTPEVRKVFPYFMDWLKELGRAPEDVFDFAVQADVIEVPSTNEYKAFAPADTYTASITFKDGFFVERREKWSDGKLKLPEGLSDESSEDRTQD